MADFETAARPYARAVFELASEEGKLDRWQEVLQAAAAIAADEQMEALFGEPAILDSDLAKLFVSVAEGAGVEESQSATAEIWDIPADRQLRARSRQLAAAARQCAERAGRSGEICYSAPDH